MVRGEEPPGLHGLDASHNEQQKEHDYAKIMADNGYDVDSQFGDMVLSALKGKGWEGEGAPQLQQCYVR